MNLETQFWNFVEQANRLEAEARRINNADDDTPVDENRMTEPAYAAIVELVQAHPESRDVFVRCFSDLILWKRNAPFMLVPFCMRALRMPEILEVIRRDQTEHPYGTPYYANRMNFWDSIGHAYTDQVWMHAIAFDYFEHELGKARS